MRYGVAKETAANVRAALKRYFAQPECAVVFEVAQSTGTSANRHLDAIAMELWPSRGLAIHGIEIKVDRNDWRREKANPEKAEEIARFCDDFFIAAPKGIVPIDELPSAWGLLELMEDGRLNPTKPAKGHAAQPIERPFLAALLRATSRPVDPDTLDSMLATRRAAMEADFERRVKAEAEFLTRTRDDGAKKWAELCKALGRDPEGFWSNEGVIAAVKAVHDSGVAQTWSGLNSVLTATEEMAGKIRTAMGAMAIPVPPPKAAKRRRKLTEFVG